MERITKINIRMFISTDNNHFNFKSFYFSEEIRKIAYTNIKLTHTFKAFEFSKSSSNHYKSPKCKYSLY